MADTNCKFDSMWNNPRVHRSKSVKKTVNALKKILQEHVNIEVDFYKELHEMEIKYEKILEPLYEKRRLFVNGDITPTDEECDFDHEIDVLNEIQKLTTKDGESEPGEKPDEDIKGIPEFWLVVLCNDRTVADMIEDYDMPILKHLVDVKAVTVSDPMSFILEFHFEPNDYFTNDVLTKTYELKSSPDPTDIFDFDGPEIVKSKGCDIDWKQGKNVTVKTIKKKQKSKPRGDVSTVIKTIRNASFFNFFYASAALEGEEQADEVIRNILSDDYDVGELFKDTIIPKAVLLFTDEFDDEFDDDSYDDDDEDSDDEENDSEEHKIKKMSGRSKTRKPKTK